MANHTLPSRSWAGRTGGRARTKTIEVIRCTWCKAIYDAMPMKDLGGIRVERCTTPDCGGGINQLQKRRIAD